MDLVKRCEPPSPAYLEELIHALDGIVWEADVDTLQFTFVSRQAERILGFPLERWLADPGFWVGQIHPEDREWVPQYCRECTLAGEDHQIDYRMIAADGRIVWLRDNCTVAMEAGRPVALRGVMLDITELKQAQARNQALLAALPDMVFRVSREGEVLDYHAPDPGALYLPPERIVGSRIAEAMPPEFAGLCLEHQRLALATGQMQQFCYSLPIGGEPRQFEARMAPSGPDEVLAVVSDVTRRVQLEQQMLQSQRLEGLGLMAGGLAHDFNNLLVGVLGNAGLALRKLSEDAPARQSVLRIEQAARRAAELTSQLLAYSGQGQMALRTHDLSLLVREMLSLLRAVIPRRSRVTLHCDELLPVDCDQTQINQLVMNLLGNAAEALGDGPGEIVVRTGAVQLAEPAGALPAGAHARLEVVDTGCGMTPEVVERIYDPFFSTKFTGRGLGMAAAHGIVRAHHGAISVTSQPGEGTQVTVLLPLSDRVPEEQLDSCGPCAGRPTVLVVDDEEIVRVFSASTLEEFGFCALTAAGGPEAIERVRREGARISLVLLDVLMPGMNGEQVYQQIREIAPDLPVVLTSGYSRREAIGRFGGMELAGFLQKPYMPEDLVEVIRDALE